MGINEFFKKSGNGKNAGQPEQSNQPTTSNVKAAIAEINHAQECITAFTRERAAKQLSVSILHAINTDLKDIVRRLSAYDKG